MSALRDLGRAFERRATTPHRTFEQDCSVSPTARVGSKKVVVMSPGASSWKPAGDSPIQRPQWQQGEEAASFQELYEKLGKAHEEELESLEARLTGERQELYQKINELRSQLASVHQRRNSDEDEETADRRKNGSKRRSKDGRDVRTPVTKLSGVSGDSGTFPEVVVLPGSVDMDAPVKDDRTVSKQGHNGSKSTALAPGQDRFPLLAAYTVEQEEPPGSPCRASISKKHGMVSDHIGAHRGVLGVFNQQAKRTSTIAVLDEVGWFWRQLIAPPGSRFRAAWEIMGSTLIIYDMFVVPLGVFCYPETEFTILMDWCTLIYWTLNMLNTMTLGFEHDTTAKVIMSPKAILMNYLKCWFWMDLVVVTPDWVLTIVSFGTKKQGVSACDSGSGSGIKLLRSLRLIRLVRLTRVAKLRKMWQKFQQMIYSVTVNIAANILIMVLLLLVISHFISCAWYYISDSWVGEDRWLEFHGIIDQPWYYIYATSMHWALTQFTPASMQIVPHNMAERVFTICVVVFALVGFSYVVGSITGSLTQLRSMHEEESKQFWALKVYLKRNDVEAGLTKRIHRYLESAWQREHDNQSQSKVKILGLLSEQLHSELLFELSHKHMKVHPLVVELEAVHRLTVFRLASAAISQKQLAKHDHLFIGGEKPSHMYIVMQGRLEYKRYDSEGRLHQEVVDKGEDWIAEPTMWTAMWHHVGDALATGECRLMLVDPKKFCDVVQRNPRAWELVTTYSKRFLQWLNSLDMDDLSDISQGEDVCEQIKAFLTMQKGDESDSEDAQSVKTLSD